MCFFVDAQKVKCDALSIALPWMVQAFSGFIRVEQVRVELVTFADLGGCCRLTAFNNAPNSLFFSGALAVGPHHWL